MYRCGFAAEHNYYLVKPSEGDDEFFDSHKDAKAFVEINGGYLWTRKEVEPLENCLQTVKATLNSILEKLETTEYELFLSGKRSFREGIATTAEYKGNRDSAGKPKYYREIRDYLKREWGARIPANDLEADDAIGIRATELGRNCVVVSFDKDLDQIAGRHYNWVEGELYEVSPREASFKLYEQLLSGDPTDNIPGLRGVGPAKARKILEGSKSTLELAQRAWGEYRRNFGTEKEASDYFREQLKLVYILKDGSDIEFDSPQLPAGFKFYSTEP